MAVGVAEALEYLHSGCARPVIHRDVKSSNILLSDDFEPQVMHIVFIKIFYFVSFEFGNAHYYPSSFIQLCDFGLAKWASNSSSHITCTDVAGTFGFVISTQLVLKAMSYLAYQASPQ